MRLTRVLIGIAAACAACLVLTVGSATAKTVYQYEYSGEYFDGTGSTKGPVQRHRSVASTTSRRANRSTWASLSVPGAIAKFSKTGTPKKFSALNNGAGRDYIDLGSRRRQ